ncbi:MAG: hypothetical protein JRI99_09075 [Deltaproteobacteria bacterium]|nr:hypothetical protein [Deltaproteobacteria bacterium]
MNCDRKIKYLIEQVVYYDKGLSFAMPGKELMFFLPQLLACRPASWLACKLKIEK